VPFDCFGRLPSSPCGLRRAGRDGEEKVVEGISELGNWLISELEQVRKCEKWECAKVKINKPAI